MTEFAPTERITWTGGMPLRLFRGQRTFTLTPTADGVRFVMRETYTGRSPL